MVSQREYSQYSAGEITSHLDEHRRNQSCAEAWEFLRSQASTDAEVFWISKKHIRGYATDFLQDPVGETFWTSENGVWPFEYDFPVVEAYIADLMIQRQKMEKDEAQQLGQAKKQKQQLCPRNGTVSSEATAPSSSLAHGPPSQPSSSARAALPCKTRPTREVVDVRRRGLSPYSDIPHDGPQETNTRSNPSQPAILQLDKYNFEIVPSPDAIDVNRKGKERAVSPPHESPRPAPWQTYLKRRWNDEAAFSSSIAPLATAEHRPKRPATSRLSEAPEQRSVEGAAAGTRSGRQTAPDTTHKSQQPRACRILTPPTRVNGPIIANQIGPTGEHQVTGQLPVQSEPSDMYGSPRPASPGRRAALPVDASRPRYSVITDDQLAEEAQAAAGILQPSPAATPQADLPKQSPAATLPSRPLPSVEAVEEPSSPAIEGRSFSNNLIEAPATGLHFVPRQLAQVPECLLSYLIECRNRSVQCADMAVNPQTKAKYRRRAKVYRDIYSDIDSRIISLSHEASTVDHVVTNFSLWTLKVGDRKPTPYQSVSGCAQATDQTGVASSKGKVVS